MSGLGFVDFMPAFLHAGGVCSPPIYAKFHTLLTEANQWLSDHPGLKVLSCESPEVQVSEKTPVYTTDVTCQSEFWRTRTMYLRFLRVWTQNKGPGDPSEPVRLGYVNTVPRVLRKGGQLRKPKYDTYGNTISRFNDRLKTDPLPGRILNIETHILKFYQWSLTLDPDETVSLDIQARDHIQFYLSVIRVFYQEGPPEQVELGVVDFVPQCLEEGRLMSAPLYADFSTVVSQAATWLHQNPQISPVNVQSISCKFNISLQYGCVLDTQRTLYYDIQKPLTHYVRFLRVYIVNARHVTQPVTLTYRTFMPGKLSAPSKCGTSLPLYEGFGRNMKRVSLWLKATGGKVISVETPVAGIRKIKDTANPEQSCSMEIIRVLGIRVYLDGEYSEPDPDLLLPLPDPPGMKESNCCCLII